MMQMLHRHIFPFILLCALCAHASLASAQDDKQQGPDLQTTDNTIFDPTREEQNKEDYHFGVEYRIEAGYQQPYQRTENLSYPNTYLHGARVGATFTFLLPAHFSLQTGVLYSLAYGHNDQHWRSQSAPTTQEEYIRHRLLEHNLTIPVRAFYTVPLWKKLNLFFYGGPQLHIGLAETDYMQTHLSEPTKQWLDEQGIPTSQYDRFGNGELCRANIQMGVGGGLEWDMYRLQAGYDFGLNNLVKTKRIENQQMWEWGWYVSFSYRLNEAAK